MNSSSFLIRKKTFTADKKKDLVNILYGINDLLGIEGKVTLDKDSDDQGGKAKLDQKDASKSMENKDIAKTNKRLLFM